MRRFTPVLIAFLLVAVLTVGVGAATHITNIMPGNGALCSTSVWVGPTVTADGSINLCATPLPAVTVTATQTGTATMVGSPTAATASPSETATSTPSATATATDTPTLVATLTRVLTATPLATLVPTALMATVTPTVVSGVVAGQPCPATIHDQYKTTGPDGRLYPTWHPPVDPGTGCLFGHEHGDDPRTSLANSSMPAFGYIGGLVGDAEPHPGFKVFVVNHGAVMNSGVVATASYRVVFHHGTSGVGRYTTEFHSMQYDWVGDNGNTAHVMGMAYTGPTSADGSTCDQQTLGFRQGAKDFSTLGCDDPYEIWENVRLWIQHPDDPFQGINGSRVTVAISSALFDPITTRNPVDNSSLLYTQNVRPAPPWFTGYDANPLSPDSLYQGCQRELYSGPNSWHNYGQPTTYYTDAYGFVGVNGQDAAHPLKQEISATNGDSGPDIFLFPSHHCGNGIHSPN